MDKEEIVSEEMVPLAEEVGNIVKLILVVAVGVLVGQLFYDWFYCLLYSFEG